MEVLHWFNFNETSFIHLKKEKQNKHRSSKRKPLFVENDARCLLEVNYRYIFSLIQPEKENKEVKKNNIKKLKTLREVKSGNYTLRLGFFFFLTLPTHSLTLLTRLNSAKHLEILHLFGY